MKISKFDVTLDEQVNYFAIIDFSMNLAPIDYGSINQISKIIELKVKSAEDETEVPGFYIPY